MWSMETLAAVLGLIGCGLLLARERLLRRELRELRQAFTTLVNQAPMGVVQTNGEGRCMFGNATWSQLSGLSQDETLGNGWERAVHPDDMPAVREHWLACVRDGRPYYHELRLVRADGSERTVAAVVCPIPSDTGRPKGFIGTVIDVTEMRGLQQKVRDTDALLRSLIDHSSAAIYIKDREGRYLLANQRHVDLWPAMRDFQPGTTPYDWFPEEVARSFIASDREVLRSGTTHTFEETIPNDDGPRTYLSVKFPVRDESGRVVAVGGISSDVTELQESRRELADRERLLRSLIEVQEGERQMICHEFHDGLIQYVVGSKMILERLRQEGLPAACQPLIETAISCLARGLEDGRRVIRGIRPAALDDLGLRAAIDELVEDVRSDGVVVEARVDAGIDAIDESKQTAIYRIVQELFNNAIKHSGTGRLELEIALGVDLQLVVEDFGRGFDVDEPKAGFGLVGIRERVRLAGGTFTLRSTPGRGTRTVVHLPLEGQQPFDGQPSTIAPTIPADQKVSI